MILTSRRVSVLVATFGLVIGGSGVALASGQISAKSGHHVSADSHSKNKHAKPASKDAPKNIPNLGQVKLDIKDYYGDTGDGQATASSRYARQVKAVEKRAKKKLPRLISHVRRSRTPVVLVDVDDTTLQTYNYEATHDFGYDAAANAAYIHDPGMTKVFGMPKLLKYAHKKGAEIYFLTGRPVTQRKDTLRDLRRAGYPDVRSKRLFLRNKTAPPSYLPCEPNCTTIQYKSLTRKHINASGNKIVLNMGDQQSDLSGGYSVKRLKVPNPMYYLP